MKSEEIDALYSRVYPMIERKAARMMGDTAAAKDVAQETFLRLLESRHTIREPRALVGWLYTTATRLAIRQLRRQQGEELADHTASTLGSFDPNPETLALVRSSLHALARRVSSRDLGIAVLAHLDGLTQPTIAELLNCSDRTVRRALTKIAREAARNP